MAEHKPLLGEVVIDSELNKSTRGMGVSLLVDDVSFYVKEKAKEGGGPTGAIRRLCNREEEESREKKILHEAHCYIPSGSLTAIMGPSGAGKSTLMDILANKRKKGRREGVVYVNGRPQDPSFRRKIAYCTQEDILIPDLTVYETLYYAAHLLLPPSMPESEKLERVEMVLVSLRLTKIRDSLVGGGWTRGISGGEKRRVSIGLELLTLPCVLLGDELTSGLDSFSAFSLMNVLSSLASDGNTVVMNIHQPSSTLYSMFDNLILLADGRVIYAGPLSGVAGHFSSLGFVCPPGWAMADFLLELVSRCGEDQSRASIRVDPRDTGGTKSLAYSKTPGNEHNESMLQDVFGASLAKHNPTTLAEAFAEKDQKLRNDQEQADEGDYDFSEPAQFANNWFVQVYVLMKRQLARWARNPMTLGQIIIMYLVSALIIGLLYSNVKETNIAEQYTLSIAFTLDMFGVLAFLNIGTYLKERALFNRESSAGYYYTSAYFVANIFTSAITFFIITIGMCAVLYYLIDYPTDTLANFGKYSLICYLNLLIFQAMIEWLSASFKDLDSALLVTGNLLVITMTLSGITVNYPNIPVYLRWLYWGNHMTYLVSAALVVIFEDFDCQDMDTDGLLDPTQENTSCGMEYLNLIGIQVTDVWFNIGISLIFLGAFRILTYISLRFLHRET